MTHGLTNNVANQILPLNQASYIQWKSPLYIKPEAQNRRGFGINHENMNSRPTPFRHRKLERSLTDFLSPKV